MNLKPTPTNRRRAFSLIETVVCVAIVSTVFVSLYGGIASGFGLVNLARENLRANQVIIEKMETIRLYNWEQINSNGYVPATFTAPFFPFTNLETNQQSMAGLIYHGTMVLTNAPVSEQYSTNMRLVTVTLTWTNGSIPRTRQLQTLVSKHGLQNYVYN